MSVCCSCSVKTDYFKLGMLESATLNTAGTPPPTPVVVTNSVEKVRIESTNETIVEDSLDD